MPGRLRPVRNTAAPKAPVASSRANWGLRVRLSGASQWTEARKVTPEAIPSSSAAASAAVPSSSQTMYCGFMQRSAMQTACALGKRV